LKRRRGEEKNATSKNNTTGDYIEKCNGYGKGKKAVKHQLGF